ncbi:MAG: hypothetical protein E7607_07055 [Ruminococcaceae bacterium]|nr:hypothetical protein [Oscillospiraceae bacterium]
MNKYYKLLMEFTNGSTPYVGLLYRRHTKELVDEAIKLNYIVQCGKNTYGEPIFTITSLGKSIRDN